MSNIIESAKTSLAIIAILLILFIVFEPDKFNEKIMSKLTDSTADQALANQKCPDFKCASSYYESKDPEINQKVKDVVDELTRSAPQMRMRACEQKKQMLNAISMISTMPKVKCADVTAGVKQARSNYKTVVDIEVPDASDRENLLRLFDAVSDLVLTVTNKHFCKVDGYFDLKKIQLYLTNIVNKVCSDDSFWKSPVSYITNYYIGSALKWIPV